MVRGISSGEVGIVDINYFLRSLDQLLERDKIMALERYADEMESFLKDLRQGIAESDWLWMELAVENMKGGARRMDQEITAHMYKDLDKYNAKKENTEEA